MNLGEIRDFRSTLRRFQRITHTELKDCCSQVTLPQCLVLMEIDEAGTLTMSELAARLGLDNSTLTRTVDRLVERELVERLRDEDDRRVVRIGLTSEGRSVCRSIHRENDARSRLVLKKIPPRRRQAVIDCFKVLVQAYLDCEADARGAGDSS